MNLSGATPAAEEQARGGRDPRSFATHLAFFWMYWVQKFSTNFQGVARVPIRSYLKRDPSAGGLGLGAAAAGSLLTAAALGWYVKALFGPITDRLPLFGYRRKSWLVISLFATSVAWFVAAFHGTTAFALIATLLSVNLAVAFSDVVCDGLMLDEAERRERAGLAPPGTGSRSLQAAQWLGGTAAMLVASVLGGLLAQTQGLRLAALISGILPLLLGIGVIALVREERVRWDWQHAVPGFKAIGLVALVSWLILSLKGLPESHPLAPLEPLLSPVMVLGAVTLLIRVPRSFWMPLAVAAAWNASPFATDTQYFYTFVTRDSAPGSDFATRHPALIDGMAGLAAAMGTPPANPTDPAALMDVYFGSVLGPAELLAGLLGVGLFVYLSRLVPTTTMVLGCIAAFGARLALFASLPLGATDPVWLLCCALVGGLISSFASLCILAYAAARTPQTDQASLFALFNGIANLSGMLAKEGLGNRIYAGSDAPETGLALVLAASAVHLVLLAAFMRRLSRRGELWPTSPPDRDEPFLSERVG